MLQAGSVYEQCLPDFVGFSIYMLYLSLPANDSTLVGSVRIYIIVSSNLS